MRGTLVAALVVGLGGCGGGDATGTEGSTASPAGAATASEVLACINGAGLKGSENPANAQLGVTDSIAIDIPPKNRIIVDFFEDPKEAASYADDQAAFVGPTGGSSETVGETVVVGAVRSGADAEIDTVAGCVAP